MKDGESVFSMTKAYEKPDIAIRERERKRENDWCISPLPRIRFPSFLFTTCFHYSRRHSVFVSFSSPIRFVWCLFKDITTHRRRVRRNASSTLVRGDLAPHTHPHTLTHSHTQRLVPEQLSLHVSRWSRKTHKRGTVSFFHTVYPVVVLVLRCWRWPLRPGRVRHRVPGSCTRQSTTLHHRCSGTPPQSARSCTCGA